MHKSEKIRIIFLRVPFLFRSVDPIVNKATKKIVIKKNHYLQVRKFACVPKLTRCQFRAPKFGFDFLVTFL